jgi:hypothetical protein
MFVPSDFISIREEKCIYYTYLSRAADDGVAPWARGVIRCFPKLQQNNTRVMIPPVLISSLAPLKATTELYSIKKHAGRFESLFICTIILLLQRRFVFIAALFCQSTAINFLLFHKRPPGCTLSAAVIYSTPRVGLNVIRREWKIKLRQRPPQ